MLALLDTWTYLIPCCCTAGVFRVESCPGWFECWIHEMCGRIPLVDGIEEILIHSCQAALTDEVLASPDMRAFYFRRVGQR